jgi:hypothetical protein
MYAYSGRGSGYPFPKGVYRRFGKTDNIGIKS